MYCINAQLIALLITLMSLLTPSLVTASDNVLKIAGWDVYADPKMPNKIIGYQAFEKKHNIKIEFTPLSNLDSIVDTAESKKKYDIYIISNEDIRLLHDMVLVKALTLDLLPNYQNLHHNLSTRHGASLIAKFLLYPGPGGLQG